MAITSIEIKIPTGRFCESVRVAEEDCKFLLTEDASNNSPLCVYFGECLNIDETGLVIKCKECREG